MNDAGQLSVLLERLVASIAHISLLLADCVRQLQEALSVSSVGSSPLQLEVTAFLQVFCVAFTILGRIEPTAIPTPSSASSWRFPLSVSSVGSSPLQLPLGRLGDAQIDDLSVSSVGSSPLQPHLDC